ncbi:hypothetical protein [Alcaligenes endophyticus]|uniref:Uncharacterized protein n=1 Tax=Alcaligenes endophyticus TaxID=1929088 RepID=A0ABT8ELN4_9BURK|nr:hypothetical protein [Alcaligenes endophyticus]MCX5591211.1 hypothetical protein [Alcaligenes endophyticus]MDN4122211.1 hypothetical protein [Alcaligenes endophyticus]
MKKLSALVILAALSTPTLACTVEQATAKANELNTKVQQLATSNPQKMAEIAPKLQQPDAVPTDPQKMCEYYDKMIKEVEGK